MQQKSESGYINCMVSIIMPVYNTEEKYLIESVESVLKQTYTNFELLIIDDGSSRYTAKVCDVLAGRDKRIRIIHKNNEGVSAARNDALMISKGDYYTFIDSDDVWQTNYLYEMIVTINDYDLDMVMCSYSVISEDGTLLKIPDEKKEIEIMSSSAAIRKLLYIKYPSDASAVFSTIYKTSVVKKICFDNRVAFAEDLLYKFECMKTCTKIAYLHKVLMAYRIRLSGTMKSNFKGSYMNILTRLEELIEDNSAYKDELSNRLVRIGFVLLRMKGITPEYKFQIRNVIKKYRWYVVTNSNCSLKLYGAIALNYLGIL